MCRFVRTDDTGDESPNPALNADMGKSHILEKPFTPEELEKFKGILQSLPSYKDGTIHNSEYIIFCNAAGIPTTPEQAEAYKNYFRVPYGDELARVSDIIKVFESLHDIQAYCLTVAKHFDKNGDGLISADEYEAGVAAMKAFDPGLFGEKGKFKFDELIKKADTNKDGKLQVEELAAWFSTM